MFYDRNVNSKFRDKALTFSQKPLADKTFYISNLNHTVDFIIERLSKGNTILLIIHF